MPLYNSLNCDILHSLHIYSVLGYYVLYGEATDKEEMNVRFGYSTPREITWRLKRKWYLQMGETPSSARIIEDIYRSLDALEIVFRTNGAAIEGIADRNGHRKKD